jgi:hypothetical protein
MRSSSFRFLVSAGFFFPALAIAQAAQTVTFTPVATVAIGVAPITLTAIASSGLTNFTFSTTSAPGICSVTGNKLTIVGVGTCALTATQPGNANFASASANASVSVVLNQANVTLIAVQSRKVHGAAGPFDLPIDTNPPVGALTVEPRAIGAGHNIVFQFSAPVTSVTSAAAVGVQGTVYGVAPTISGSEITVALPDVPDNLSVTVSLGGVNNSQNYSVALGFLVGDENSTGSVNASDISAAKEHVGQGTTEANFRFDVNSSGSISSSDISAVKARSGLVLRTATSFIAPTLAATAPPSGIAGEPYNFTFIATGSSPINWSTTAGALPAGLNLSSSNGILSGTPAATGTFNFTVQVANGVLPNATRSVALLINPTTAITSVAPPPAIATVPYTHNFTATGVQPITWTVTAGTLPAWATLDPSTGALSGTPTTTGTVSFTVTATNAIATVSRAVTILINPAFAPVVTSGTPLAIGTIGQPYSFTFTSTGSSPIIWTLASGALPGGLTLSLAGLLSGTPNTVGVYMFSVQAINGVAPNGVVNNLAITVTAADVSTDGYTLANVSKFAFITPTLDFPNFRLVGAGDEVRAYALNPTRCSTTPALMRSWQHNIDLADYKGKNAFDFFVMQANEALSYKFTVGMADVSGGFIYNDAANATVRPTFISITAVPCDFDVSKLAVGPSRDVCYQTGLNGNSVNWANITGPLPDNYCRLVKGRTYYLNLRFQDARPADQGGSPTTDSCTAGNCGGIIQVL